MAVSREQVMAFIDGELTPNEEQWIEAEIARDATLRRYVGEQRELRRQLAADFAPMISAPVPEQVERMIVQVGPRPVRRNIVAWLFAREAASRIWIPAGAVAAGIAIGIGFSGVAGGDGFIQARDGGLVASAGLARVLSSQLAADQNPAAPMRVGLTFVSNAGEYCRTFQAGANGGMPLAGIACRHADAWRIIATVPTKAADAGEFRQASSGLPDSLRDVANTTMAGQPLAADGERAARARNWLR